MRKVFVSIAKVIILNKRLIEYLVGGERFTELGGYRFDKLIFGGFILLVLALFMIMFLSYGADRGYHIYYFCDADARDGLQCKNPFFAEYPICEQAWSTACSDKFVPTGFEFGEPAPWIIKNWGMIVGLLLAGAFVVNHFMHNIPLAFAGDEK